MAKSDPVSPDPAVPAANPSSAPAKSGSASGYAKAAESGSPEVHQLLAERVAHQMNRDAITPDSERLDRERERIDAELAKITERLHELGYE